MYVKMLLKTEKKKKKKKKIIANKQCSLTKQQ